MGSFWGGGDSNNESSWQGEDSDRQKRSLLKYHRSTWACDIYSILYNSVIYTLMVK